MVWDRTVLQWSNEIYRVIIQWVLETHGAVTPVVIETGPAVLTLWLADDVICGSHWSLAKPQQEYAQSVDWTTCLAALKSDNQIKLQQQGTVFFRRVWQSLSTIPPGQTISYGELARELDSSPRAIAMACRRNPFPGIIPCHRVVAASGIGGFMGQRSGEWIALKKSLLAYEAKHANH